MNDTNKTSSSQPEPTAQADALPPRRFRFEAEPKNKRFTYTPASDWGYEFGQSVTFESPSGPFTIELERIDVAAVELQSSPLGTFLEGKQVAAGLWATDNITAGDGGLDKDARREACEANIPPGGTPADGFVARYKYHIKVTIRGQPILNENDPKNGSFIC